MSSLTPEVFLADEPNRRGLSLDGVSFTPVAAFDGRGAHALEVAIATSVGRPRADAIRRAWKARQRGAASPLMLVVAYEIDGLWKAAICGPAGDEPPVETNLDLGLVERIAKAALDQPSRHQAIRFLGGILAEVESELPGIRNHGMLATHELREGVPLRRDWDDACSRALPLLNSQGRDLVEKLGFHVEHHSTATTVLSVGAARRAVAVFLDENEEFEAPAARFGDTSPVTHALAYADRAELPWVVVTRGPQIRLYSARPDVGVGRKGRADTYVEANLALIPDDRAGYLTLLFSGDALKTDGTLTQILDASRDHASALGVRLRDRVYEDAVPSLALALASRHAAPLDEAALDAIYEQALTVLFRLLFVAYAEDKDLLPYRSNGAYRDHALKTLARELAERQATAPLVFDANATDLWDEIVGLWTAVDKGNVERGVPPYDGGLFSSDPNVNRAGGALANLTLTNAEFGPALVALLVDRGEDAVIGPVDFRSLSVREFGTIYEGLLESSLSVASADLALDSGHNYVPAQGDVEVVVLEGDVYFHDRSGARKSSGSYFTKSFAVEHLLDHALEPALSDHLARIQELVDAGEEARAAEAFFDFRCVDLAMGSGHFLVAAIDRIEARLSGFLALNPIPQVTAELDRLRVAADEALGLLGEVEIEYASLLRRQVARRCIYGVDLNPVAVELARLAIWIHTFVPGLPLSFLDHSLVSGDSLTGIGTLDEAILALDPEQHPGQPSLFGDEILAVLGRAESSLRRLARMADASAAEITDAREAQAEALAAVRPARDLFDLIVAGRIGEASPLTRFDEASLATNEDLPRARELGAEMRALHFPVSFPEVFMGARPGFDCILGNPPWEKLQVERHSFYALHYPGIRGLTQAAAAPEIERIALARPDLQAIYELETDRTQRAALALARGPYPGFTAGRPDLYKAFAWRFLSLLAAGGRFGVVLPRKAVEASGMVDWRVSLLSTADVSDLTLLVNTGGWVFDDVHQQYTICLLSAQRDAPERRVVIRGPFRSLHQFHEGVERPPVVIDSDELLSWSPSAAIPLLPSEEMAAVFGKIRSHPQLATATEAWAPKGLRELNATDDREYFIFDSEPGAWPVYKGASFDLWTPDTGSYFAFARPPVVIPRLIERQLHQIRNRRSAFFGLSREWAADEGKLPANRPRIAWRDSTNRTNQRTIIAALVPPQTVLVHQAYYIFWREGNERDEAFVLGVISSIPFDWFARQMVETHVTVEFMDAAPVPRPDPTDPIRRRVEEIAGGLASVDGRYAMWADAVGVTVGAVGTTEPDDQLAELDAAVALLYGLGEDDLRVIYATFHQGWDYADRLERVLAHYRVLA